ncbi:hypothetical protein NXC24_PB00120 (plasmid) [Rhizobium sp. NXC24]|nr:hypothetical protein NXC24_PB00120 [Rhizobium sp. NXC24]
MRRRQIGGYDDDEGLLVRSSRLPKHNRMRLRGHGSIFLGEHGLYLLPDLERPALGRPGIGPGR